MRKHDEQSKRETTQARGANGTSHHITSDRHYQEKISTLKRDPFETKGGESWVEVNFKAQKGQFGDINKEVYD